MRTLIGSLILLGGLITFGWLHAQEGEPGNVAGLVRVLDGHGETVYAAAYSPDGKIIATGSFDQTIKLWDPNTGKPLRTYAGSKGHQKLVLALAFSQKGDLLASGGGDNKAMIWDVPVESPIRELAQNAEANALSISADAKRMAVACRDGSVKVWDLEKDEQLHNLTGHVGEATDVWFSQNNQFVVSSGADQTVRLWNANDGKPMGTLGAHAGVVTGVTIHPNNSQAYSIGDDGLLKFWKTNPENPRPLTPHEAGITSMILANDGTQLLTGGSDKIVRWSNFGNGQKVRDLQGAEAEIASVAIAPNNQIAAAGLVDGNLVLWQGDGKLLAQLPAHVGTVTGVSFNGSSNALATVGDDGTLKQWQLPIQPSRELKHNAAVTSAQLRPDGQRLITGSTDQIVRLWRLDNNTVEREFKGHDQPIHAVSLAPNGQFVLSAADDGVIKLWNAGNGQVVGEYGGHTGTITSLFYSPRNDRFVTTGEDGLIKFWQLPPQQNQKMDHPQQVRSLVMAPSGERIVTAADDNHVRLWNLGNGNQERAQNVGQKITATAIGWDNASMAASSADKIIRVWDGGGKEIAKIEGVPAEVSSLAFTKDNQKIAAGLTDNTIRVYQISDGEQIQELKGHASPAVVLAYTADSQLLLSGSGDKSVRLWNVADGADKGKIDQPAGVVAMQLTGDGKRLVIATSDKQVQSWTLDDKKVVAKVTSPVDVRGVSLSNDGKLIGVAGADNVVRIFGDDGKLRETFTHGAETSGVAIHPDGKRVASTSRDKTAQFNNLSLLAQTDLGTPVRQAIFTNQGDRVLSVGDDKILRIWDASNGTQQKEIPAHDGAVLGVSVSNDAAQAVTIGADKKAIVWNLGEGKAEATVELNGTPESVAFTQDRQRFAVSVLDGKSREVTTFSVTGQALQTIATPTEAVRGLGFGADHRTLMIAEAGPVTQLIDAAVFKALPAHPEGVVGVAFHSDNVHAFTAGKDKAVRQWNLNELKEVRSFGPLPEAASCLALSRDFQSIAAGSGKTLTVWNVGDGKELARFEHPAGITSAAFSGDKQRLVTGASDGLARVWEVATSQMLEAFSYGASVTGVAYHPSQQYIAAGSADKTATVHPISILRLVVASEKPLASIGMYTNGQYVLTGDEDGVVKAWNTGNGNPDKEFKGATGPVRCVAISKNGQVLATGADDKTIRVYRFDNTELVAEIVAEEVPRSLSFHPNGLVLSSGLDGNQIRSWNVAFNPGQPLPEEFGQSVQSCPVDGRPAALEFDKDGKLFSANHDKTVKEWKIAGTEPVKNINLPNLVDSVAFSPDGTILATGCHDGRLRLFDVEKGNQIRQIDAHIQPQAEPIYSVTFSPDGTRVASGSFDGSIKVWQVSDGKLLKEMKAYEEKESQKGHRSGVFCVAFSPDGKSLASGSSDRSLKLWDVDKAEVTHEFANPNFEAGPLPGPPQAHPGWIYQIRFIDDGSKLVSAGSAPRYHGYVAVWNVSDGKMLGAIDAPIGYVHGLGVAPDASHLVLGCGPRERGTPDARALIVKTPGK